MIYLMILIFILVVSFWGAFGWLIKSWWSERKAQKDFEDRQERYRRML